MTAKPDKRSLNVLPSSGKLDELRRQPAEASEASGAKKLNDQTPIDLALDASLSPAQRAVKERIVDALRTVYDPELPVNLFDLGLIYRIDLADAAGGGGGQDVAIDMTLTAPACPVAGEMPGMVRDAVLPVEGVAAVRVELVWSPRWDKGRMSEAALLELGLM